jgi:hypothetical protein
LLKSTDKLTIQKEESIDDVDSPQSSYCSNRMLGIIFINTYGITSVVYQGIAKMATGTGVDAVELCLFKTLTNLVIASMVVRNTGLHPFKSIP